jgi:hypothetical protein
MANETFGEFALAAGAALGLSFVTRTRSLAGRRGGNRHP